MNTAKMEKLNDIFGEPGETPAPKAGAHDHSAGSVRMR